jgi:hypothetical protein
VTLCTPWIDEADVAECCEVFADSGSAGAELLTQAAAAASEILYELSGGRYNGICTATVRPCADPCRCGWGQILSTGHIIGFQDYAGRWYNECGRSCGCSPLSRVKLPGYPVADITEVKIDGVALVADSSDEQWILDRHRWLVRSGDPVTRQRRVWPGCQRLDLPDDELGTFSITYTYGQAPPESGIIAARELACQLALASACHPDCALPAGVTQVVRQGVAFSRSQVDMFGKGRTGLVLVDAFLGAVNPSGLRRRPAVYSPDVQGYARPV